MTVQTWETPQSSNVASVSYDSDTQEMTVTFQSGGSYVIANVEATTASDLANSPSPGAFYNRHIRNRYGARKL